MVECSNCGMELANGIKLCPKCGMIINLDYPEVGDEYQDYSLSNKHYNFFQRIFLVLFSRDIQTDICRNSHNGEAFILFILVFVIEIIPYYLSYLSISHIHLAPVFGEIRIRSLQSQILIILFSPFLIVGISMIGNILTNMKNSFMQVFRLYIFMNFPLSIINFVYNYFISNQRFIIVEPPYTTPNFLLNAVALLFILLLFEVSIVSFGYRTLFNCSYAKAFLIYFIASIIVGILANLFFSFYMNVFFTVSR